MRLRPWLLATLVVSGCDCADPEDPEGPEEANPCAASPCDPSCRPNCALCPDHPGCFCALDRALTCEPWEMGACVGAPGDTWSCERRCCVKLCDQAACQASCPSAIGCSCDGESCRPLACSAGEECPGGRCADGWCDPPREPDHERCELYPHRVVLLPGNVAESELVLRDSQLLPMDPAASLPLLVDQGIALEGPPEPGRLRIRALEPGFSNVRLDWPGGGYCETWAEILPPPVEGESLVVVADAESGSDLLVDADMVVQAIVHAAGRSVTASIDGKFHFPGVTTLEAVDVVAEGYETVSLRGALGPVVIVPLRKLPHGQGAARSVVLAREPGSPPSAHLVGFAFPPSPRELGLRRLLGPEVASTLQVIGASTEVRAGAGLGQGSNLASTAIQLEGCRGPYCRGSRALWASSVADPLRALDEVPADTDAAWLLLQPAGARSVGLDADQVLLLTPLDEEGIPRTETETELELATDPLLRVVVDVPPIPLGAGPMHGAFVGAAVELPGRGLVVRGIASGVDAAGSDGVLDEPLLSEGRVPLEVGPRPTGARSGYTVFAIAGSKRPTRWRCDEGACVEAVRLVHFDALPDGSVVELGGGFLPAPDGRFDPLDRVIEVCVEGPATAVRATIYGDRGVSTAWAEGPCATIELPAEDAVRLRPGPEGFAVELQALELDRSLRALVEPGGIGLERALDATSATTTTRTFAVP